MRPLLVLPVLALAPLLLVAARSGAPARAPGAIVAVGGGAIPDEVLIEALAATGKENPRVLVLPQASSLEDRGASAAEMWRAQGVEFVDVLDPLDEPGGAELIEKADLIWFSGGSQVDLMKALALETLTGVIGRRHSEGCVIGGTSAGAAVMGAVMISGDPDPKALVQGAATPYRGLGLWSSAIVDQHFVERGRFERLMTAVLAKPRMLGVGLGEGTAVIVTGDTFRVVGAGQVVVHDARQAEVPALEKGELQRARGMIVDVLVSGEQYTWFR